MATEHPSSTRHAKPSRAGAEDAEPARLSGFQRKYLRGLAHGLEPVVHVGRESASEGVIAALDDALITHELIKVRLHRPPDKKAMAAELARSTGAHLCGIVGHMVILYRKNPEEPKVRLPAG
jgi:RNA-binding protein